MIAAVEFAVILIFVALATFLTTRFFVKHSRKRDPLTNDLNMIFFRDPEKLNKKNK